MEKLPDAGYNSSSPSTSTLPSAHLRTDARPLAGSSQSSSHKRKATTSLTGAPTQKQTCQSVEMLTARELVDGSFV